MQKLIGNKQTGMTFIGLVLVIAAVVCIAVVGMKVAPAYGEFMNVKKAIKKAAGEADNKKDIAASFDRTAQIDNIESVKGADLVVNNGVATIEYQKVIPIVANASILLDFSFSSAKK